jgi:hypothetical protein
MNRGFFHAPTWGLRRGSLARRRSVRRIQLTDTDVFRQMEK